MSCCNCKEKKECTYSELEITCDNCYFDNIVSIYKEGNVDDTCDVCIGFSHFKYIDDE